MGFIFQTGNDVFSEFGFFIEKSRFFCVSGWPDCLRASGQIPTFKFLERLQVKESVTDWFILASDKSGRVEKFFQESTKKPESRFLEECFRILMGFCEKIGLFLRFHGAVEFFKMAVASLLLFCRFSEKT